jgi:adenylate kinase family enzyme
MPADPKHEPRQVADPLLRLTHHQDFEQLRPRIAGAIHLPDDIFNGLVQLRSREDWPTSKKLILGHVPSTAERERMHDMIVARHDQALAMSRHENDDDDEEQAAPITKPEEHCSRIEDKSYKVAKRRKTVDKRTYVCLRSHKCRQLGPYTKLGWYRYHLLSVHDIRDDAQESPVS